MVGAACLAVLLAAPALLADRPNDLGPLVNTVYSFHPHRLTEDEITAKSKELDEFWETVQADTPHYLPLLRQALARDAYPSFFFYDGSKLLLSLSTERQDEQLALKALPRSDLRDIQPEDYVLTVFRLAQKELDTSEAAFKILQDPKFQVVIPEHALTLKQDFVLIVMLLPTSEEYYVDKAAAKVWTEPDPTAQKSLLRLLWYTVTDAGDEAIARIARSNQHSAGVRAAAKKLISATEALGKKGKSAKDWPETMSGLVPKKANFTEIKSFRRSRLNRISDEALSELDNLTIVLRTKRKTSTN